MQSRNHPEVDGGWLCDKGASRTRHLYADDRIRDPLARVCGAGARRASPGTPRSTSAEALLRASAGGTHRHRPLRLRDDRERVRARASCCAEGVGAHTRRLPGRRSRTALDAFRRCLSTIARRRRSWPSWATHQVVDRTRRIVDLWIKEARRRRRGVLVRAATSRSAVPGARRRGRDRSSRVGRPRRRAAAALPVGPGDSAAAPRRARRLLPYPLTPRIARGGVCGCLVGAADAEARNPRADRPA